MSAALSLALEACINKALRYDPASRLKLHALAGKRLSVKAHAPDVELTLAITSDETKIFTVSPIADTTAECLLEGQFSGFIALLNGPKTSLAGSQLTLKGETGFLMSLLDITRQLDIDWEDALAEHFGQNAGHNIAELVRFKSSQFARTGQRMPQYIHDFLTEEIRCLPSAFELEDFYDGVDDLREGIERLEARINAQLAKVRSQSSH